MVAALLSTPSTNQALHPYIPVQVETLDRTKTALVDSRSCYNVISYKFFETLEARPLAINETPMFNLTGTMSYFMGTMHLKMQVGLLSCLNDFFIMPPKSMVLSMIVGTPWERKYKALPHWDTNAIHFQQEDGYISQPFVPARSTTSSTQLKVVTNKGKQKAASSDNRSTLKTKLQMT